MATKEVFYKGNLFTIAMVDDEDLDIVNKSWFINFRTKRMHSKYFQLKRNLSTQEFERMNKSKIYMHHEIWIKHFGSIPEGMTIDHIDFNTANNKKENLRLLPDQVNRSRHFKQGEINGKQMDQTTTRI